MGRAYGIERGAEEPYPDYPKRITFLIDPSGDIAKVYVVSDVGAHPDEVLEDIQRLSRAA